MRFKQVFIWLLSLILVLLPFQPWSFASEGTYGISLEQDAWERFYQYRDQLYASRSTDFARNEQMNILDLHPTDHNQRVRVIVSVEGEPLIQQNKGVTKNDLISSQTSVLHKMSTQQIPYKIMREYTHVLNGFSAEVTYADIEAIRQLPGVVDVRVVNEYFLDPKEVAYPAVYHSGSSIGADIAWGYGYEGEGTIVAIIDSGVNYYHPAFGGTGKEILHLGGKDDLTTQGGYSDRVIGGYNWADNNNDIVDRTSIQHGVHVAGIAVGNDEYSVVEDRAFRGVAPKARILAEKVFPNDPGRMSTTSDEIIAAIEHSVAHGADVINMSLGSSAGALLEDDPEIVAIQRAVEAGVVVTIAAGNDAYSTFEKYKPQNWHKDYATIGSPSTAPSAISVASSDNGMVTADTFLISEEISGSAEVPMVPISALPAPSLMKGEYEIIDVGAGSFEEFEQVDVQGKVALVELDTVEYEYLYSMLNAEYFGAKAVLFVNQSDELYSLSGVDIIQISGAMIQQSLGNEIRSQLANGKKLKVRTFNHSSKVLIPAMGDVMSEFSSWGPEPGLHFGPTLTAPGGNIYSSVGDREYMMMSGTSMATPQVAGAVAVLIDALKAKGIEYTPADIKAILSNTSKVLMDPSVNQPFSVRQQGVGRIQLDQAVVNEVIVTAVNGEPNVALGEFDTTRLTFDLELANLGAEAASYQLDGNVYHEKIIEIAGKVVNSLNIEPIKDATVSISKNEIHLEPYSNDRLQVTVELPATLEKGQFVEGWITLTSLVDGVPDLVVPYFGYYGDWHASPILDEHWSSAESFSKNHGLWSPDAGGYAFLLGQKFDNTYEPEYAAISPDGNGFLDVAKMFVSLLRNTKRLEVNVLDHNYSKVRTLGIYHDLRKDIYFPYAEFLGTWDGTVNGELAHDGQYYIQVTAQSYSQNEAVQEYLYPVKIDTQAPTLSAGVVKGEYGTELRFSALDPSGIYFFFYEAFDRNGQFIDANAVMAEKIGDEFVASISLPQLEEGGQVFAFAQDHAGNVTPIRLGSIPFMADGVSVDQFTGMATLYWALSNEVQDVLVYIDGSEIALSAREGNEHWRTSYTTPRLSMGAHTFGLQVIGADGLVLAEVETRTYQDVNALELNMGSEVVVYNDQANVAVEYSILSDRVKSVEIVDRSSQQLLYSEMVNYDERTFFSFDYAAPKGESTLDIHALDADGVYLGQQSVHITHLQMYDVKFEHNHYYAEDQTEVPIYFFVGDATHSATLDVQTLDGVHVQDSVTIQLADVVGVYTYLLPVEAMVTGEYMLSLQAYDAEGESLGVSSISKLHLIQSGPLAYVGEPHIRTNQELYTLMWGYDEGAPPLDDLDLFVIVDGQFYSITDPDTNTYEMELSLYRDGEQINVDVVVMDHTGIVLGKLPLVVEVDRSAPVWQVIAPDPFNPIRANQSTVWYQALTQSTDLDVDSIRLQVEGSDQLIPVEVIYERDYSLYILQAPVQFTQDGFINIELTYQDDLGNRGYIHRKVPVDLHSPSVSFDSSSLTVEVVDSAPGDEVYHVSGTTTAAQYRLSGIIREGFSSFGVYLDGSQIMGILPTRQFVQGGDERPLDVVLPLKTGVNEFGLVVQDGAGNQSTYLISIERRFVDETPITDPPIIDPPISDLPMNPPSTSLPQKNHIDFGGGTIQQDRGVARVSLYDTTFDAQGDVLINLVNRLSESNTQVEIELSVGQIQKLGKRNLVIQVDGFSSTIPGKALGSMVDQIRDKQLMVTIRFEEQSKNQTVHIGAVPTTTIVSEILSVEIGVKGIEGLTAVSELEEGATFSLNLLGTSDPRKVGGYIQEGNLWMYLGGKADDHTVIFTTKSLGRFAAIEQFVTFDDISAHWAKDEIEVLAAKMIVRGTTEGYLPNKPITRAEFAALLTRLLKLQVEDEYAGVFTDVPSNAWYRPSVEAAQSAGIIIGENGLFNPLDHITREQMAVMIARALTRAEDVTIRRGNLDFVDAPEIAPWARDSMEISIAHNIIKGNEAGQLVPKSSATRAEAAVMLYRLLQILDK